MHMLQRGLCAALAAVALVGAPVPRASAAGAKEEKKGVRMDATMCKQLNGDEPVDPTDSFPKTADAVHGAWWSPDVREGQVVKVDWIAADVGKLAPPNTKITSASLTIGKEQKKEPGTWKFKVSIGKLPVIWTGHFSLSRPNAGWPVGKYVAKIYLDGELKKEVPFTIQ